MKAKPKKVKRPSRLDAIAVELRKRFGIPQGVDIFARLQRLSERVVELESVPSAVTELQDWRERALKAESTLAEQAAIRNVKALERRLAEARGELPPPTEEEWRDRAL